MAYQWAEFQYQALPAPVQQVRALLEDWFWAMERGEVEKRLPDPTYQPAISQETADAVMEVLDKEFEKELDQWAYMPEAGSYEAGPQFRRLKAPQRVALAQQLHAIYRAARTMRCPSCGVVVGELTRTQTGQFRGNGPAHDCPVSPVPPAPPAGGPSASAESPPSGVQPEDYYHGRRWQYNDPIP